MSTIIAKIISSIFLSITGLVVVKNINNSKVNLFNIYTILLMSCLIILPAVIYDIQYTYLYSIIVYLMTIVTYKYILNISFRRTIISCTFLMLLVSFLDSIFSGIIVLFSNLETARSNICLCLISSMTISTIILTIVSKKSIRIKLNQFITKLESSKATSFIIFSVLIVVAICIVLYVISKNFKFNAIFTTSFFILIILYLLVIILINEKNSYDKLYDKYDNLFSYVKVFEDWIENEQLNRHEYKNQLAVLRCMTKEKKVKDKIDSIINDYINVDNEMINQLKNLPNGGIKGLLYYKMAIAKNNAINLEIDIGRDVGKYLNQLTEEKKKVLSNLIGIYLDNAIEAAKDTKKKVVSMEIYEYEKTVNFVISNTYNTKEDISNRNQKGFSTKGIGRGNGLYFAGKLLSKNDWISEKQDIIDGFYIERLKIQN